MEKEISQAVIRRLPRYYRYLGDLLHAGVERISSNELSVKMHVTASQIRQDLNNFGGFGQQGYGYNVLYLYEEIGKILGLNQKHNVIVIGVGNLGHAIANYISFERLSFSMIGAFDVNPDLKGKMLGNVEVQMVDELPEFLSSHHVDLAALTLPKESAEVVAQKLISLGVKAFWNFAHVDLDVPEGIVVQNVHLSDSLMQLSYNINQLKD
ncbi:redox-sensing transcriptional repressor [Lachnospiraceae bacterium XBD2001]|jgi:redox-sensing transcriptional repressor|nr:redox-sensing transcriptional repressor [Lachnospiraceae bacterium XBD2001]